MKTKCVRLIENCLFYSLNDVGEPIKNMMSYDPVVFNCIIVNLHKFYHLLTFKSLTLQPY